MSLFLVLMMLTLPLSAFANCVTLDLTAWTPAQRGGVSHVAALAANDAVHIRVMNPSIPHMVEVCTPTVDLTSLDTLTLQNAAQVLVEAHAAAESARHTARETAHTRVRTNNLCTASFTEVENRLDTMRAAIQADIDAIDATNTVGKVKAAMTTETTRFIAAIKQLAECVLGRATLQGQEN